MIPGTKYMLTLAKRKKKKNGGWGLILIFRKQIIFRVVLHLGIYGISSNLLASILKWELLSLSHNYLRYTAGTLTVQNHKNFSLLVKYFV